MNAPVEHWSTDEISLAAYIATMFDVEPEYVWDGSGCYFTFPKNEDLLAEVHRFVSGDARVEPKEYHLRASAIRKKMFQARDVRTR